MKKYARQMFDKFLQFDRGFKKKIPPKKTEWNHLYFKNSSCFLPAFWEPKKYHVWDLLRSNSGLNEGLGWHFLA